MTYIYTNDWCWFLKQFYSFYHIDYRIQCKIVSCTTEFHICNTLLLKAILVIDAWIVKSTISVPQSIFNYFRELVYLVVFLNGIQEHSIKNQFVIFDFDSITMQPHNISRKSVLPRGEYNVENLKLIQKH